MAFSAELLQRRLGVQSVPQDDCIGDQPECTELILLPLAVALADLAALSVADFARYGVTSFAAVELDQDAAPPPE